MRVVETVMGIPMSVDIRDAVDGAAAAGAASAAFAVLREADERFSVYRPDSEVSAVNRGEHPSSAFSAELSAVIALGEEAERASGSAFRIRKPDGALDLDGVVKGWAAARAAEALRNHGMRRFCLNAGGDVVVGDAPDGAAAWNVGVRAPSDPDAILAVLAAENAAVATSGAYERGAHIVDGRTGAPAAGLLSATVVADDLTTADILATAVFALGRSGVDWAIGHGATGVLALTDGGELLVSGTIRFARAAA